MRACAVTAFATPLKLPPACLRLRPRGQHVQGAHHQLALSLPHRICTRAGTDGLGLASAVALAQKGAHVIITARSHARGQEVLRSVGQQLGALGGGGTEDNFIASFADGGTGTIEYAVCDHEDLHSVKDFATWFKQKGLRLDVLMLNAGQACVPYKLIHGVESQLFVNHVAHHYLTSLLLSKV